MSGMLITAPTMASLQHIQPSPACSQHILHRPILKLTQAWSAAGWRATVSGLAEKFARPLPSMQPEASNGLQPGPMPDSNGHAHSGLEGGLEQIFPASNSIFDSARHSALRQQSLHQQLHDRQKNRNQFHKVGRSALHLVHHHLSPWGTVCARSGPSSCNAPEQH